MSLHNFTLSPVSMSVLPCLSLSYIKDLGFCFSKVLISTKISIFISHLCFRNVNSLTLHISLLSSFLPIPPKLHFFIRSAFICSCIILVFFHCVFFTIRNFESYLTGINSGRYRSCSSLIIESDAVNIVTSIAMNLC
jgi:hypothetical protein